MPDQAGRFSERDPFCCRRHFERITVSLGDHDVTKFHEADSIFLKVSKIVRFPTYDENYVHGDLALLRLESPVKFTESIAPVCLPVDDSDDFGYREGIITGGQTYREFLRFYSFVFFRLGLHRKD